MNGPGAAFDSGATDKALAGRPSIETIGSCWAEALKVGSVDPSDNFFDLGGDSITAVELLLALQTRFGLQLDLSVLFEHSTLAEFYAHLGASSRPAPSLKHLSVCRAEGDAPPLFCFAHLAYPPSDRPVYYCPGYYDQIHSTTEIWDLQAIERIAAECADEVNAVYPEGDLHFSGFCHGSWIALAIAQRLAAQGRRTAYFGLIESFPKDDWYWPVSAVSSLRRWSREVLRRILRRKIEGQDRHVANMQVYRVFERRHFLGGVPGAMHLFFRTDGLSEEELQLAVRRWRAVAGADTRFHRLPGSHMAVRMQEDPLEFGRRIDAFLQEASRDATA
ncbi:phosphopantetheine-binding protein [Arenimonas sp.]|uniref:phosphopantetheine-binding protein n=1 Tax=Arenimonas sp. TaxID=1872635 RepID=UPI0039E4CA9D